MVRVAPIKMQVGPKVFWFDPAEVDIHKNDAVIVQTERGHEFGYATSDIMEVSDELVEQLKSPLKPVLRLASEADIERAENLAQKAEEALPVFKEMAAETNEDMRPVAVEFLFDGDKAVFYFEAEQRVDFRELVRKLAAHFHMRVDMRQIGVRDAARMIGGLGHCGQELCCKRMGGKFMPVSIRMAKEQSLSLNPQKISGVCGRLMCCLRYEYDTYKEVNSHAPKIGGKVSLPEGQTALVSEINVPSETVTLSLEDGQRITVPLAEMDTKGEGKRPNAVSEEVLERYTTSNTLGILEAAATLEVASFSVEERLAQPVSNLNERRFSQDNEAQPSGTSSRKPRKRRRRNEDSDRKDNDAAPASSSKRPGQKSSGLRAGSRNTNRRNDRNNSRGSRRQTSGTDRQADARNSTRGASQDRQNAQRPQRRTNQNAASAQTSAAQKSPQASSGATHRKSRRRRHTSSGGSSDEG